MAGKPPVFFVVLVVLMVVKTWLMRGFALDAWNPIGVVFEVAFVILVMGLVDVIPPRRWYWLDLVVYSLLSVLLFAMTVYVHFYATLFDPHMMAMAGQLGSVSDAIGQLIKPVYALFFVDIPILAVWVFFLQRRAKRQRQLLAELADTPQYRSRRRTVAQPTRRSLATIIVTAVATVVLAGQLGSALAVPSYVDGVAIAKARGLSVAQAVVFIPRAADTADDSESNDVVAPGERASAAATTSATSTVATVTLTPGGKAEARIERIRGSLEGSRIATFSPGAYKGKNVIIVQVEALNTMVMQNKIDGQEITPNLDKLIGQSWYFPNTYSETGLGNTADAEFIVNSSLYAPRSQAAAVAYPQYKVPALPRLIGALGYDTFTLHPNKVGYWNRKELYASLGFSHYYDAAFFHYTDIMGMGPSDEVLFRKGIDVLKADDASGTPFYSQFITLSAHTPFDFVPQSRRPVRTPSEYKGSLLGDYISAESYSDYAIGKFIKSLKKAKIWDKSIVIFYGDHTSMLDNTLSGTDADAAQALLGRAYGPADRQRIPLIIHLPGQTTPQLVQTTTGQVDIMPTVADLLGIDLTQVPHMGRSVFVQSNGLYPLNAYLPGGSFVNDRVLFMPGIGFDDGTAVNMTDSSKAKKSKVEETDYERMLELTRLSDKWVRSLPIRKNAGKLGDAWIPNEDARKAGASLGALQSN
ncbi:MAG: LTA synthase family protein [Coriobacteriia bacterium]|nr:LTA synthase family protein [Coriobacteriia bacterium]